MHFGSNKMKLFGVLSLYGEGMELFPDNMNILTVQLSTQ